jgi:hypothetical protein
MVLRPSSIRLSSLRKKKGKYRRNLNEIGMSTRAIHYIFKKLNKSWKNSSSHIIVQNKKVGACGTVPEFLSET